MDGIRNDKKQKSYDDKITVERNDIKLENEIKITVAKKRHTNIQRRQREKRCKKKKKTNQIKM